ncbi:unnamed protein product [Vicia faba]|uniref:Phosphoenolpyruvate carboxylase n=1 Tax=Vicia faba TaxID=3906 RepID=A0AAV1AEA9_VICFA|nr:unnamed protein product [Vicia faba]
MLQRFTAATLEHGMYPPFVEYFRLATPELEYGRMNIGSRPAKFHLPVWLGFGAAFKHVIDKDIRNLQMLQEMYNQWPFFRVTIDLVEMVFAKGDPGIAALYDRLLVSDDLWSFGELLRTKFEETKQLLLQVAAHKDLLEGDPYLKQRLRLRDSYITTLNVCQAYTLKRIRDPNYNVKLRPHIHHIPSISLAKLLPTPPLPQPTTTTPVMPQ